MAEEGQGKFWSYWGDGKAELAGYALRMPRYGQMRDGTLVLIYVTEDFLDRARVKSDRLRVSASQSSDSNQGTDVYPVMKLNAMRKFQTGIYDYSVMTSVFARVDNGTAGGGPLRKLSLSSQEWCGHVYHQVLPQEGSAPTTAGKLLSTSHSYFEGEADDQRTLEWPTGALAEDELPLRLRSFVGQPDLLPPGERRTVPLLKSLMRVRLLHQPLSVGTATIERLAKSETVKTAAGTFTVTSYVVTVAAAPATATASSIAGAGKSGDRATFQFEAAPPHRLIRYAWDSGETATLTGSARLPYWKLHDNGHEAYLKQLGLVSTAPPVMKSAKP